VEKLAKKSRGNTDISGLTPLEQLELWKNGAMRQNEAIKRATYAADLVMVLWEKLSPEQREALRNDEQVQFLVRHITSRAYGL